VIQRSWVDFAFSGFGFFAGAFLAGFGFAAASSVRVASGCAGGCSCCFGPAGASGSGLVAAVAAAAPASGPNARSQ